MDIPAKRYRAISWDSLAILVALADGPQIGSALYDVLHRLEDRGLVTATGKRYSLTDKSWHCLKVETRMLKLLLDQVTRRLERHSLVPKLSQIMARTADDR